MNLKCYSLHKPGIVRRAANGTQHSIGATRSGGSVLHQGSTIKRQFEKHRSHGKEHKTHITGTGKASNGLLPTIGWRASHQMRAELYG